MRSSLRLSLGGMVVTGGFLLATACAGDGAGPNGNGNGNGNGNIDPCSAANNPASTLSCDVQPILTASCALSGCHAGASPQQGMNLSQGQTFTNVVNVTSLEAPNFMRIRPNLPDSSYLVHKIQGTQASLGGSGGQMPLGGTPLSQAQIDTVRSWVTNGALNN